MVTRSVLIIEDEESISLSFQHVLKQSVDYNYTVTAVGSAEEALQAIERSGMFDIVLLDIFLPGENGIDFLKKLRSMDTETVVICISGTQDYRIVHDVFKLGADDFISKVELSNHYVLEKAIFAGLEKREYQRRLLQLEIQAQRMEAITTIIRTIHHELNNPLAILRLASSKLGTPGSLSDEELRNYCTQVQENIDRMADVLKRLPMFHEELFNTELRGLKVYAIPREHTASEKQPPQ